MFVVAGASGFELQYDADPTFVCMNCGWHGYNFQNKGSNFILRYRYVSFVQKLNA